MNDFFDDQELDPDLLREPDKPTTDGIIEITKEILRDPLTHEEIIQHVALPIPEVKSGGHIANLVVLHARDDSVSPDFYFGIGDIKGYEHTFIFDQPLLALEAGDDKYLLELHPELDKQSALDMVDAMSGMFSNLRLKSLLLALREQLKTTTVVDKHGRPLRLIELGLATQRFSVSRAITELLEQEDVRSRTTTIMSRSRHILTPQASVRITQETRPEQPGYEKVVVTADSAISETRLRFFHVRDDEEVEEFTIGLEPLRSIGKRRLSQEVAGYEYTQDQFENDIIKDASHPADFDSWAFDARSPNEYKARGVLRLLQGLAGTPND